MATKPLIILARHKYLLLVPFLVIVPAALLLSVVMRHTTYTSKSTIWASDLPFLPQAQTIGNSYLTPAQNQANALNERLGTDAFVNKVSDTVSKDGVKISANDVRNGTYAYSAGMNSLVVTHTSSNAADAQRIVKGVVDEYKEQYVADTQDQIKQATELLSSELRLQEKALNDARDKLAAYVQDHPSVVTSDAGRTDPTYQSLIDEEHRTSSAYDSTQASLSGLTLSGVSTLTGIEGSLEIVDPANLPTKPVPTSLRKQALFPMAGLLLAISLAAAVYAFMLRTDNSIRVAEDLQALPGLALLGSVPDVQSVKKRGWPKHFFRLAVTALGVSAQR